MDGSGRERPENSRPPIRLPAWLDASGRDRPRTGARGHGGRLARRRQLLLVHIRVVRDDQVSPVRGREGPIERRVRLDEDRQRHRGGRACEAQDDGDDDGLQAATPQIGDGLEPDRAHQATSLVSWSSTIAPSVSRTIR